MRQLAGIRFYCTALTAIGLVGIAMSGEIIAPSFMPATNFVAEGATDTQRDRLLVSSEGMARKFGGGDWTIPYAFLSMQSWPIPFDVAEGGMTFGLGSAAGSYTAPTTLPSSITDKALIWVDAADPISSHIAATDGAVSTWYDRREGADVSSPVYCRASSYTAFTNALPEMSTVDNNLPAVYFGGRGNGRCMEFLLPSGSRFNNAGYSFDTRSVCQVFVVHKVTNTYGDIFGTFTSNPTPFMRGGSSSSSYYWHSTACWPALVNGRTYRNGQRIDGTLTTVGSRLQLLEAEREYNVSSVVGGLFASTSASGAGGDYICEVLAFTNRLTETERLLVTEYLMAKWLPDASEREIPVHVEAGASFTVDASESAVDTPRFVFTGNGTIVKTGGNTFTYDNNSSASFDGSVRIDGGTVELRAPAAIAVSSPGRITAAKTVNGPTMSVTADATSKTLAKDGEDIATIHAVPSGVERVSVEAGTLSVRKAPTVRHEDVLEEIPIRDGSFEEYDAAIPEGSALISAGTVSIANGGWGYAWNQGANVYIMDYDRWMSLGKGMDGAALSAWAFIERPPEGKCAMVFRPNGTDDTIVRSEPFTLAAGTYELRFWMSGRQSDSYRGQIFRANLIEGSSATVKARFGDVMYQNITRYTEYRLRATVANAGSYRFEFRSLGGRNGVTIIDDVHFFKVTPSFSGATRWAIPGGDFETDSFRQGASSKRFSVEHTHENWTFTQSPTWTEGKRADIGISTICATNLANGYGMGVFYNDSRRPATGSMELCLAKSNCWAETSFQPPAGRWQLQGDIARFGSHGAYPKVTAIVTIDGVQHVLGKLTPETRLMGPMAWPIGFEVDGSQTVTLRLVASDIRDDFTGMNTCGLLIDDLVLVGATDLELFKDGNCEYIDDVYALKSLNASVFGGLTGICRVRPPSESNAAFGTRTIDGSRMVTIENLAALYEDVTFPFPGRYRLSFYAHSRLNDKTSNYQPNPLRAWIAADGVTNVIGYANTYNSEWVQRVFDFSVPSAGVWRVALQGCHNPDNVKAIHEAHVDAISLRQIPEAADRTPPFPEKCKIRVAEGARLETDFAGTNTVRGLRLGSQMLSGIVKVEDYPDYLGGRGAFNIKPDGTIVSFR